jgi:hypothetical protein
MKKIKILKGCAGIGFSFAENEICEVEDELAEDLVRAGYAEYEKQVLEAEEKAVRKTERKAVKRRGETR